MRFLRRLKRTTRQYIIVAFICIAVIGTAAIATSVTMIGQIRQEYEYMLSEARREISENKKTVLVAVSDIKAGEILSLDMVEERLVYSSQPVESYITKDDLGKTAIIDIQAGTHIIKGMVAPDEVPSVLREVEYDVIHISSNIDVNDYVDVRICYPNGETFVVLSKKQLKGYRPNMPVCYLWVDEEELLRMSAAIVDAGLYTGSRLYMTKYIEPNIQEASVITYTPGISVLKLIENDPNIVDRCSQLLNIEVRKALENRLAASLDANVKDIYWELDGAVRYMPEVGNRQSATASIEENNEMPYGSKGNNVAYPADQDLAEGREDIKSDNEYKIDVNDNYRDDYVSDFSEKASAGAQKDNEFSTQPDMFSYPELGINYDYNYFIPTEG